MAVSTAKLVADLGDAVICFRWKPERCLQTRFDRRSSGIIRSAMSTRGINGPKHGGMGDRRLCLIGEGKMAVGVEATRLFPWQSFDLDFCRLKASLLMTDSRKATLGTQSFPGPRVPGKSNIWMFCRTSKTHCQVNTMASELRWARGIQ